MRTLRCTLLLLTVCLAAGCGSGAKNLNGKIVKDGQPFTLSEKGVFELAFVPDGDPSKTYSTSTKPDGTFVVNGPDGKGIPPGKYKVQMRAMDPYPKTDKLGNKYATADKSPLVVEVGKGEIVIDVGK